MRNNNGAIVRKITGRTLRVNIRRNFFITAAIALTAFMIASVFSVGMGYYRTVSIGPFRFEGTQVHMGFIGLDQEQLDILHNSNLVRHISFNTPITDPVGIMMLPGFDDGVVMVYTDRTSWDLFQTPTFTNVRGRYAEAENEIMLSREKLSRMGIENPYVGMSIPLDFIIHGSDEVLHETFILSAFYTEFVSVSPCAITPVFVSQAFTEMHGRYIPEKFGAGILFRNRRNAFEYSQRLRQELNLRAEDGQYAEVHPAIFQQIGITTMYIAMGIIVAFLMFVGFLLIYNVMFVSVSKDVRFYGLLKTLGTTPRQLIQVVNGQVLRLYVIGVPLGLSAAALASFAIVPAFLGGFRGGAIVDFSPLIFVGGAVFTLITAYLSAFTSARKAARISPIEAIRYSGEQRVSLKAHSSAKGKSWRMAFRNMFRERKQAIVVLLSLFLGVTVFISIMTIVVGFDIDNDIDAWYTHDFAISVRDFGSLNRDTMYEIAAIPGVTQIDELTITLGRIPEVYTPAIYNAVPPRPAQVAAGSIRGICTSWLLELDPYIDIDINAFERGEIALLESSLLRITMPDVIPGLVGNNLLHVGDMVDIELGEFIAKDVEIGGHIYNLRSSSSISMGFAPISIIMSNVFLQQHIENLVIDILAVNIQEGMDSQVNDYLNAIIGQNGSIRSRYEARQAMEEARMMMFVLGVGISVILGLIGIFNFINVISVGLLVRKREFAALESVGMSRTQMRTMLRWEGALYWIITIMSSITIGSWIAYGIFSMLSGSSPTQFPNFIYPLMPVIVAYIIIIAVCGIVPELAYKNMSKHTLVERLREAE